MEQAGCAAGEQASGPGADDEDVIRLCGACAMGLISPLPGRLRDPPWGYYGPCARSSLEGSARMPVREARRRLVPEPLGLARCATDSLGRNVSDKAAVPPRQSAESISCARTTHAWKNDEAIALVFYCSVAES